MKKGTVLKAILVVAALALSLFLAIGGSSIEDNLGIRTPGTIASKVLVSPKPFPHAFGALGDGLRMQMFVDWVFWFALMWLVYFAVTKLGRLLTKRQG
jgi:hypothetical protein